MEDLNQRMRRKSSFDRFGDDLAELIVSYLPIEEKFRLECLSKQIQSLVFNKQYVLNISAKDKNFGQMFNQNVEVNDQKLETILRKLKFLTDIRINELIIRSSKLLRLIADNCHHLTRISFPYTINVQTNTIEHFGKKCGQKLKYLTVSNNNINSELIRHLLSFTPDLVSLNINQKFGLYLFSPVKPEKHCPQLTEFECNLLNVDDLSPIQLLYGNQLVRLTLNIPDIRSTGRRVSRFLSGHYPRLQSLQLTLAFRDIVTSEEVFAFFQKIRLLATNCPKLRRLSVTFNKQFPPESDLLAVFSSFTSLTSLELNAYLWEEKSFKDLKQLSQLKQLIVSFQDFSDNCFENIGQYLPQLESLVISSHSHLTDKSLEYLTHLERLKSLTIKFHSFIEPNVKITSSGVKQLLDNCPNITRVVLKSPQNTVNISSETIELFKEKAKRMPKIQFNFGFNATDCDLYQDSLKDLPHNLIVNLAQSYYS